MADCDHCGESLDGEAIAEVYNPEMDQFEDGSAVVHQEPCATWMLDHGWEIA